MTQIEQIKAEIERQKHYSDNCVGDKYYYGWRVVCERLLAFLDTLEVEQPEVDLEKEIKRFLSNATKMNKGEWRGKYPISDIGFRAVACHFYELGLNAREED